MPAPGASPGPADHDVADRDGQQRYGQGPFGAGGAGGAGGTAAKAHDNSSLQAWVRGPGKCPRWPLANRRNQRCYQYWIITLVRMMTPTPRMPRPRTVPNMSLPGWGSEAVALSGSSSA